MKISKLFHWLYASVMFLPLLIIPIFAIWTINHDNNQAISIDVSRNKVVDFNQNVNIDNSTLFERNTSYEVVLPPYVNNYLIVSNEINIPLGHKFLYRASSIYNYGYRTVAYGDLPYISYGDLYNGYNAIRVSTGVSSYIQLVNQDDTLSVDTTMRFNVFDLTQMFGEGNEPTLQEFNQWYTDDYYAYSISKIELLKDYEIVTYDNTDVGSQFIYTLYRSCEDYLNFDDVLSLGSISDWIETNVFNGNAPLVYTIVWHYLDYWLILSIFWLCFDVLIYVPQIAHRWLDKASLE